MYSQIYLKDEKINQINNQMNSINTFAYLLKINNIKQIFKYINLISLENYHI